MRPDLVAAHHLIKKIAIFIITLLEHCRPDDGVDRDQAEQEAAPLPPSMVGDSASVVEDVEGLGLNTSCLPRPWRLAPPPLRMADTGFEVICCRDRKLENGHHRSSDKPEAVSSDLGPPLNELLYPERAQKGAADMVHHDYSQLASNDERSQIAAEWTR